MKASTFAKILREDNEKMYHDLIVDLETVVRYGGDHELDLSKLTCGLKKDENGDCTILVRDR